MTISYMEINAIFCTRIDFTNVFVMSLDFAEIKNIENMSMGDALRPSTALLLFISDKTIYHNRYLCLILNVEGCLSIFCTK